MTFKPRDSSVVYPNSGRSLSSMTETRTGLRTPLVSMSAGLVRVYAVHPYAWFRIHGTYRPNPLQFITPQPRPQLARQLCDGYPHLRHRVAVATINARYSRPTRCGRLSWESDTAGPWLEAPAPGVFPPARRYPQSTAHPHTGRRPGLGRLPRGRSVPHGES